MKDSYQRYESLLENLGNAAKECWKEYRKNPNGEDLAYATQAWQRAKFDLAIYEARLSVPE